MRRRRLLTLSHSYVVTLNRRLVRELAATGGDAWEGRGRTERVTSDTTATSEHQSAEQHPTVPDASPEPPTPFHDGWRLVTLAEAGWVMSIEPAEFAAVTLTVEDVALCDVRERVG